MKKLIILLLILTLSLPVFAGAYIPETEAEKIGIALPSDYLPEKIIERQIVMKEAKEIKPLYGLTLGFVNDYPMIGYSTQSNFIEAGGHNVNGDWSGMIRFGSIIPNGLLKLPKYARLHAGMAINIGLTGKPNTGLFLGGEENIDERTILFADVFAWSGGGHYAYPTVSAGGKITL